AARDVGHGHARSRAPRNADGGVLSALAADGAAVQAAHSRAMDQPRQHRARPRRGARALPAGADGLSTRPRGAALARVTGGPRASTRGVRRARGAARRAGCRRSRRAAHSGAYTVISRVVPAVAAAAVSALGMTLSVRVVGLDALRPLWQTGHPLIYGVWHAR